jgi:hypothetical protein
MEFPPELEAVEGAKNLRDWFGYWPNSSIHPVAPLVGFCFCNELYTSFSLYVL